MLHTFHRDSQYHPSNSDFEQESHLKNPSKEAQMEIQFSHVPKNDEESYSSSDTGSEDEGITNSNLDAPKSAFSSRRKSIDQNANNNTSNTSCHEKFILSHSSYMDRHHPQSLGRSLSQVILRPNVNAAPSRKVINKNDSKESQSNSFEIQKVVPFCYRQDSPNIQQNTTATRFRRRRMQRWLNAYVTNAVFPLDPISCTNYTLSNFHFANVSSG